MDNPRKIQLNHFQKIEIPKMFQKRNYFLINKCNCHYSADTSPMVIFKHPLLQYYIQNIILSKYVVFFVVFLPPGRKLPQRH